MAAGDAVPAVGPGPPHRVTNRNVDWARHKLETSSTSHRHIDSCAGRRWNAVHVWLAIFIENCDRCHGEFFLRMRTCAPVAGFSSHQKCNRKNDCQPKDEPSCCAQFFHGLNPSSVRQCDWDFVYIEPQLTPCDSMQGWI